MSPQPRRGPRGGGGLSPGGWAPQLTPRTAVRIAILGAIAMSLLGLLLVRLWFLQVISGEDYAAAADSNRLRTVITEAPRGNILDRNGDVLVANRPGKNVVVHPRDLTGARREEVLSRLAPKLHLPLGELIKKVDAGDSRPLEPVVLAENVAPKLYYYLAQRRRQYPGVGLEDTYLRTYPQGDLAAHVLGQVGKISADQIDDYRRRGYAGNETVGKGGIEQEYEQFLKGTPGRDVVEVDASGEPVGREVVSSRAPSPGHDIQLSIDGPTQRAMQDALRQEVSLGSSTGAAGVALDPATGEVLAMASYPTYDPSVFVDGTTKQIDRVNTSPDTPALNRAIAGRYPSGSTFKVITASAALEAGYITPGELIDSPSEVTLYKQVFPNFKNIAHGPVDLPRALEVSSDTYFYKLGDRFYRAQGSPLQAEAEDFGLGRDTGIDLPGEEPGLVPTPAWKRRNYAGPAFNDLDRDWKPGDTIQLAVGQGYLLATPLQMAVAYAAVADGGDRAHAHPGAPRAGPQRPRGAGALAGAPDPQAQRVPRLPDGDPAGPLPGRQRPRRHLHRRVRRAARDGQGGRQDRHRRGGGRPRPLVVRGLRALQRPQDRRGDRDRARRHGGERRRAGRVPHDRGVPQVRPGPLRRHVGRQLG